MMPSLVLFLLFNLKESITTPRIATNEGVNINHLNKADQRDFPFSLTWGANATTS